MAQCKISLKKLSMNLPDSVDRHYLCHGVHGTFLAQMRPLNLFVVCILKKSYKYLCILPLCHTQTKIAEV